MDKIALLQSEQAFPFIDYMISTGMPAAKYLEQANLPLSLLEHRSGMIMEKHLWQLLDNVSEQESLHDFGLCVGNKVNIEVLLKGIMPRLMAQPTLLGMLQAFSQLVNEESSDATFWLTPSDNPDKYWFCRGGVPGIQTGERDAELYTLVLMIKLVRLLTGPDWVPDCIHLKTSDSRGLQSHEYFHSNLVKLNEKATAIEVPAHQLNKLFFDTLSTASIRNEQKTQVKYNPIFNERFSVSLSEVLSLYFASDNLDLKHAADMLGISARTLQRQLSKESTNYAKIVDLIRFNSAIPLLKDKKNKLVDIAYDLGYSDPAHFSRAFKRWSGVSPREFRCSLQAQNTPELVNPI